jgi:hypothetical protein
MKSANSAIEQGGKKLQQVIWAGLATPGIWTIYDLLFSRIGFGFFMFMLLTIGITLGSSMTNGSSSARWTWVVGGFLFTAVLVIAAAIIENGDSAAWMYMVGSAILVFVVTIFTIVDSDIKAYIEDQKVEKKVPMRNEEMEGLIEEIGRE